MSYKDLNEYYIHVCADYARMKKDLELAQKQIDENLMTEEQIKALVDLFQPIKNRYQEWSYIKYLMDKPVRKKKQPIYDKQNKKRLSMIDKNCMIDNQLKADEQFLSEFEDSHK